jgi:hypothetical protein
LLCKLTLSGKPVARLKTILENNLAQSLEYLALQRFLGDRFKFS